MLKKDKTLILAQPKLGFLYSLSTRIAGGFLFHALSRAQQGHDPQQKSTPFGVLRAENEIRTRDPRLGKAMLYH